MYTSQLWIIFRPIGQFVAHRPLAQQYYITTREMDTVKTKILKQVGANIPVKSCYGMCTHALLMNNGQKCTRTRLCEQTHHRQHTTIANTNVLRTVDLELPINDTSLASRQHGSGS